MLTRFPDKPHEMSKSKLDDLDHEGGWIATSKGDGWRCMLINQDGCQAWSRHNKRLDDLNDFNPDIMESFRALETPPGTILDTEWIRRRTKAKGNFCMLIGILRWGDKWLHRLKEKERFDRLLELKIDGQALRQPRHRWHSFGSFFRLLESTDKIIYEGIVLKHQNSRLILNTKESKKNPLWVKIKWRGGADGQRETL